MPPGTDGNSSESRSGPTCSARCASTSREVRRDRDIPYSGARIFGSPTTCPPLAPVSFTAARRILITSSLRSTSPRRSSMISPNLSAHQLARGTASLSRSGMAAVSSTSSATDGRPDLVDPLRLAGPADPARVRVDQLVVDRGVQDGSHQRVGARPRGRLAEQQLGVPVAHVGRGD